MSGTHRLAFASLLRALQANRGMVTLLAQAGLGKTTLLFYTLQSFGEKVTTVYLSQAAQTPVDLLQAILTDLGVCAVAEIAEEMLPQLKELLSEKHRLGKRVIVVIDEAQDLHASVFDVLSLLSNLESPRGRLIQFILCGQPMLGDKLAAIKSLQSMQRGMPTAHLEPFSAQETAQYIDHRLRSAGYVRRSPLFTPEAAALVARYSQGSPRIINSLCFEALSICCQDKREHIAADTVRQAAATLNLADARLEPGPKTISVRPVVAPSVLIAKLPAPEALPPPKLELKPQPDPCALLVAEKALVPPQPPTPQTKEIPNESPALVETVAYLAPQGQRVVPAIALPAPVQPFARHLNTLEEPTKVSAKPKAAPFIISNNGFATHPSTAPLLRGLTIATVLLLAVTGAIFGLYKTKSSHRAAKQAVAAPPDLRPAALAMQREQPRAIVPVPAAAPAIVHQAHADGAPSSMHDLKGMDLQSALRALPSKGQRHRKSKRQT